MTTITVYLMQIPYIDEGEVLWSTEKMTFPQETESCATGRACGSSCQTRFTTVSAQNNASLHVPGCHTQGFLPLCTGKAVVLSLCGRTPISHFLLATWGAAQALVTIFEVTCPPLPLIPLNFELRPKAVPCQRGRGLCSLKCGGAWYAPGDEARIETA